MPAHCRSGIDLPPAILMPVRIKFCGITRVDDAREAARLGAWAIGLNHWEESPRRCDPAVAAEIGAELRRRLEIVGVFVNASLDEIVRAAEDEGLTMVQLHGDEGPAFCKEVARRTGLKVIKALRVRSTADIQAAEAYRTDFHLLDAHRSGMPGGTGESFDWEIVRGHRGPIPVVLAGGLRPGNVAEAIGVARPFAVDVASGIESAPGIKDHSLMAEFADNARRASAAESAIAR
jgi:phosphoribosylanthranilate isomerase